MKIFSLLTLLSLAPALCHAAVSIVDVSSPFGGSKTMLSSYGQTFTPTITGTLDGLRLYVASPPKGAVISVSVWDYDVGSQKLGSILGSGSYIVPANFLSYQWIDVLFSTKISQIAERPLAFTVSNPSVMGPAISSTSQYIGGAFFEFSGSQAVTLTPRDLTFQTMVTAIPESQGSSLLGAATALAAFRRKRAGA
ncbi:MAG: hypothetical protein V4584_08075 [Verrucomicrobiota bacterium]